MGNRHRKQKPNRFYSGVKEENDNLLMELIWKQREGIYLQYLLNLLGKESFMASTNMSMSPVTIYHILNEIIINNRSRIIEFGSGNSTICIAALLSKLNLKAKFYSIDDDNNWLESIKQSLILNEVSGADIEFIHAPIKETTQFVSTLSPFFNWYDTNILENKIGNEEFDLIIIDGPKGTLCPFSRFPAIPFLVNHLANSYSLFLDDIDRMHENTILKEWSTILNQDISFKKQKYGGIFKNARYSSYPK